MLIDISRDDADVVRELLQNRLVELDKEINRTDSLAYKASLQQADRAIERVLGQITTALNAPSAS